MKARRLGVVLSITLVLGGACAAGGVARSLAAPHRAGSLASLEEARMKASDAAAEDSFGTSVAISGNTAVVGAPDKALGGVSEAGAAYVFTRSGAGWTQRARLTVPTADRMTLDRFGTSVAISGNTILVSSYFKTYDGMEGAGAVYVYTGSGATWTLQATLNAGTMGAHEQFGWAVALSGDTALVGDLRQTVAGKSGAGSAYVFTRAGAVWTQQQMLTASDAAADDRFGFSVALDGDNALVGADKKTVGANAYAGSVYVFTRSGAAWSERTQLAPSDGAANRHFGDTVALSGDTALVGRYYGREQSLGGVPEAGAAYVFTGSGASWTQQAELVSDDNTPWDLFGTAIAIEGDRAVVGAPFKITNGPSGAGAAYVFDRSGAAWSQVARVLASDQNSYDVFGASVALSGARLLVGAPGKAVAAKSGAGAAYVRLLGAGRPSVTLKAVPTSLRAGKSVTFSGAVKSPASGYRSLVLKRKSGARWIVLKTLAIGRSGGYSWRMRTTKSGKLQVVATYVVGVGAYSSKQVTVKVL